MARVDVIDHNVGGGTTYGESLWSDGKARVGTSMRLAQEDPSVDAVTLQECLLSQFEFWKTHMGWNGIFAAMREAHEANEGEPKGLAVLTPHAILDHTVVPLGNTPVVTDKDFNLLSVQIDHPGFVGTGYGCYVATTHLWSGGIDPSTGVLYPESTDDDVRRLQANKIVEYLNPRVGWARKYVLTGDFNTSPKTPPIDNIHRVKRDGTIGTAKFWEADQSQNTTGTDLARGGRDTVAVGTTSGRKIDYWFGSHIGATAHEDGIDMELITADENNGGAPHDRILQGWIRWTDI
jgi:hypothetical protein